MKIDIHKVTAAFAVLVLAAAVLWWIEYRKRESESPVAKKLMDSLTYHMNEAQNHADIARGYVDETEKYAEIYKNPRFDSVERDSLGAKIYADAVRKADSLRERATR